MQSFIATMVVIIQLALSGFVVWGGWLVLKEWFRLERKDEAAAASQANAAKTAAQAQADDFERVASLVLLALLCTTLMAAA